MLSPSPRVRKNAQSALEAVADVTHSETLPELLKPHAKTQVLDPIYAEPLGNYPRIVQTGYLDAMTYCLNLRPPVVHVDDRLIAFVKEAFALAKSDDNSNLSVSSSGSRAQQQSTLNFVESHVSDYHQILCQCCSSQ